MQFFLKKALLPVIGAVLTGAGAVLSGVDPSPYATEIGVALGGLITYVMQSLLNKAKD